VTSAASAPATAPTVDAGALGVPGALVVPGTLVVPGPAGAIECLVTGQGSPVTAFVHGLTGSIAQTRPFGSGVIGSRVFIHLRGHGGTLLPADAGGYPELASDVAAVIAAVGASRALGVSLGAGALLTMLAGAHTTVQRLVLCLPPAAPGAADRPDAVRAGFAAMADALEAADVESLARGLLAHQPAQVRHRPAVRIWARRRAGELIDDRSGGLARALRQWPGRPAVPDPAALAGRRLPDTLILAQDDDPVHPVAAAQSWADLLGARLEVLPAGSLPWSSRDRVRDLITGHLNG
jgi:pimeloyl-ACP methyl ester carboxylesterase